MGKGRIVSAHGEGLYTIELLEDRARANAARALAVYRVADLDARLAARETDLAEAQAEVEAAADALDQAINDYQAEIQAEGESDIDTAEYAAALQEAAAKRDGIASHIRSLKTERLAIQRRIDLIDALPPLRQIQAWCADLTEDLSGEIATAEVPGEVGQVIIKPGFEGANQWSPGADGALQPALSSTPAGVFYNLAMLPGWQKWRPTFRIATISNIDNDLCDITLDPATSSQQGLNVNAQGSYSGVPIMYMDCNGDAFEDGDRVLVAFSGNTDQPMVVGFESHPQECCYQPPFALFDYADALFSTTGSGAKAWSITLSQSICIESIALDFIGSGAPEYEVTQGVLALYKCSAVDVSGTLLFHGPIHGGATNSAVKRTVTFDEEGYEKPKLEEGDIVMIVIISSNHRPADGGPGIGYFRARPDYDEIHALDWVESIYPDTDDALYMEIGDYSTVDHNTDPAFFEGYSWYLSLGEQGGSGQTFGGFPRFRVNYEI